MEKILSVENMRNSDAATIAAGTPGLELMYHAGEGIYNVLGDILSKEYGEKAPHIIIVCGSGNNAGDGYVLALLLKRNGIPCRILLTGEKFSADGEYYYRQCTSQNIEVVNLANFYSNKRSDASRENSLGEAVNRSNPNDKDAIIIVDCLLGTGFKGEPRGIIKEVIDDINSIKSLYSDIKVVSVDINSGLNGDNGTYASCVCSDITISIGGIKPGLLLNSAKDVIGKLINIDIGIEPIEKPYYLFEEGDAAKCIPERKNESNKGTYGYIALIGGSDRYSGAIRLASMSNAAMRSGAGVVFTAVPSSIKEVVATNVLESTIFPLSDCEGQVVFNQTELDEIMGRARVIAFGMGIGKSDETKKMIEYILLKYTGVLIIDADGLNCIAELGEEILMSTSCDKVILTPHIKELSRLTGMVIEEIKTNPVSVLSEYAKKTGAITLLKGPTTIISDGDDTIFVNRGCAGMATAGSGDVLSGILAATCAYIRDARLNNTFNAVLLAVATGVYINGCAGELAQEQFGSISMIASDTVNGIPEIIRRLSV